MTANEPDNQAGSARKTLSADDIKRVLDALDASAWDEAIITVGDVTISVARNGATLPSPSAAAVSPGVPASAASPEPVPASGPGARATAAPVPATAAPADPSSQLVTSPSVGVFWRAPEPGAPAFVEIGQHVAAGDTLCIIEVMKLMSHVDAPVAGTVTAILAENAVSVEHGAPLFTFVPDED